MKMLGTYLISSNYRYAWCVLVALVQCSWEVMEKAYQNLDNNVKWYGILYMILLHFVFIIICEEMRMKENEN